MSLTSGCRAQCPYQCWAQCTAWSGYSGHRLDEAQQRPEILETHTIDSSEARCPLKKGFISRSTD